MVKKIAKIGNSKGLVFDSALLKLANLEEGDEVNVEVHSGGTITVTPLQRKLPSPEEIDDLIEGTMGAYAETMKKLAQ